MKLNKPICIIPARFGSKRIKNKNILKINNKPLIEHTIKIAKKSKLFEKIIVTTDSKKIAKLSISAGAQVPFLRSKKLSGPNITIKETMLDCIKKINSKKTKYHFCLFPSAILIKPTDLKKAYRSIVNGNFNAIVAVVENKTFYRSLEKKQKFINFKWKKYSKKMSQDLKPAYSDSGTFYIFNTKNYCSNMETLPKKTSIYLLDKYKGINVDDQNDLKFLKIAFNASKKNN